MALERSDPGVGLLRDVRLLDERLPVTSSPDGGHLAAAAASGGTLTWDIASGAATRIGGAIPLQLDA